MNFARIKGRWPAVRHKVFVRGCSSLAPYYLVNEFPKSGGTWLAQMLSDALDLPFRCNAPIRFEPSVTHGHFLSPFGLRNVVTLWRDPRDMMVSFYYHCYFVNDIGNAGLVALMKARCPFENYTDIRVNLPVFIRFVSQAPVSPRFTWPQFVRVWAHRPGTVQTSYEALRADTPGELMRIVNVLTGRHLSVERAEDVAEQHRFARAKAATARAHRADAEISFVREGALGGWRKHFTAEAESALRECGYEAAMRSLGYEVAKNASVK